MNKTAKRSVIIVVTLFLFLLLLFSILFSFDNKYTFIQPLGDNGSISFSRKDLEKNIFLIDGWIASVDGNTPFETFIGEYSNYLYTPGGTSPFGTCEYKLTLNYLDEPTIATMQIPEIFSEFKLYINGKEAVGDKRDSVISFYLDGKTELKWVVTNNSHYYSGLYYPPAIGTSSGISDIFFIKNVFYSLLCVSSLTLAIFSTALWFKRRSFGVFFHFAILCYAFCLSCMHNFIWQMGGLCPLCYALEDASRLLVWGEAMIIGFKLSPLSKNHNLKKVYAFFLSLIVFCFVSVAFIIPQYPGFIPFYGHFIDICTICSWMGLAISSGSILASSIPVVGLFCLAGCTSLGAAIFSSYLDNNAYEPIYTAWQSEWAGFIMVCIFGSLLIWLYAEIIKENKRLTAHLEETVSERTAQLEAIIEERKRFFSDMAHNLKAPIAAIHGFINLIHDTNVGVDDELLGYIKLIESENLEMRKRVQALNTLNDFDKMTDNPVTVSVNYLLQKVYDNNSPEAEALGITLKINKAKDDSFIKIQEEKFLTMFENLIYNSLSFTPMDGSITITAVSPDKDHIEIDVTDTGEGIDEETLPMIFERFFVGRKNKSEGSGLGLYIAKLTCQEAGGKIEAFSKVGEGTTFKITIPAAKN